MVLEQIYPVKLVEKNLVFALILGVAYALIGIGTAVILFPEDPAIVAVAFTAILIIPTVNKIFKEAEYVEGRRKQSSLLLFFKDHWRIFIIYALLFLGIFMVFAFFSLVLPNLATNKLFENQLAVRYGDSGRAIATGGAILSSSTFKSIFFNNLSVLMLCLITSFIFGDGAFFVITWNASVWGTIFGALAKGSALAVGKSPFIYFMLILISVFPHMILEAMSYFSGATAGGIMSKGMLREDFWSSRFFYVLRDTVLLILVGLLIVFIAAYVETYVLQNFEVYRTIIRQSFG